MCGSQAGYSVNPSDDLTVLGLECDVASEESVRHAYQKVIDKFGRIDSVVASAGDFFSQSVVQCL